MGQMGGPDVLATDLDGTLIPLEGTSDHRRDLKVLTECIRSHQITLLFVTGRYYASIQDAIQRFELPSPDWIIADVGTTIRHRQSGDYCPIVESYSDHLEKIVHGMSTEDLAGIMSEIAGMERQEDVKQGRYKLSYYTESRTIRETAATIEDLLARHNAPYSLIHSIDPFNGDGLIDLLPKGVSKAYALQWWTSYTQRRQEQIVFAGDSGNDLAALTAGYRAILVGNAAPHVVEQARGALQRAGLEDHLVVTKSEATSGVLEGCRHHRLFTHDSQD